MLNDIIALNNRAINSFTKGNENEDAKAVVCLHEALCRLRNRFPYLKEYDGKEKLRSARVSACNRFSRRPIKRRKRPFDSMSSNFKATEKMQGSVFMCNVPITKKQQQQQQQQQRSAPSPTDSNENLFSFYQHAFFMSATTGNISMGKKSISQVYIALLYNIGLALHVQGSSRNSNTNLKKAQRFYELAMSMIAIEWKEIDPDDLLLMLAVSSNLGHIHSHLLNFSETQRFLTWLRHLMKVYQQCNTIIPDKDYSFFFGNSLFLEDLQELTCAPTA